MPGPHPAGQSLKHTLLTARVEVVPLQDVLQRVCRQLQEVALLHHLREIGRDVVLSSGLQAGQDVAVSKIQDSNAAFKMKGLAEESGACIDHTQKLQETSAERQLLV